MSMEYDYDFYEKAWLFWTRELYPRLTGMLYPDALATARLSLEDWLSIFRPGASVVCNLTNSGTNSGFSIIAEIHVPDSETNEIRVYPLHGGPYILIKLT